MAKEPLFASERRQQILEMIEKHKKVTVPQLSELFQVSGVTIRNDLRELEMANLLTRTHGGAILAKTGVELDSVAKGGRNHKEKMLIAREALELVEDGDTIALDTGTTTLQLTKLLGERKDITVVTNDIIIARSLENHDTANVVLLGGIVRKNFRCTLGLAGIKMLEEMVLDKAFMATNSFSLRRGATTPDINQAEIKQAMMKTANRVYLLCDSSKFGWDSFMRFGRVTDFDVIVSDSGIKESLVAEFETRGIQVIVARE